MGEQQNIDNATAWGDAINSGHFEAFDNLVASSVIDHDPAPNQGTGAAGFKKFFTELKSAFPDAKVSVEKVVTNGDFVTLAYTLEGTHEGPFLGIDPTGKHFSVRGMQLARYESGKMIERWGSSDELGILQQIGAKIST